jgi:hypothetical protein
MVVFQLQFFCNGIFGFIVAPQKIVAPFIRVITCVETLSKEALGGSAHTTGCVEESSVYLSAVSRERGARGIFGGKNQTI